MAIDGGKGAAARRCVHIQAPNCGEFRLAGERGQSHRVADVGGRRHGFPHAFCTCTCCCAEYAATTMGNQPMRDVRIFGHPIRKSDRTAKRDARRVARAEAATRQMEHHLAKGNFLRAVNCGIYAAKQTGDVDGVRAATGFASTPWRSPRGCRQCTALGTTSKREA